jgi:hypothetical protein
MLSGVLLSLPYWVGWEEENEEDFSRFLLCLIVGRALLCFAGTINYTYGVAYYFGNSRDTASHHQHYMLGSLVILNYDMRDQLKSIKETSRLELQRNRFNGRNRNRRVRKRNGTELESRKRPELERNYSPGLDQGCSGTGSMAGTEIVEYGPGTEPRKMPEFNGTGTTVPLQP